MRPGQGKRGGSKEGGAGGGEGKDRGSRLLFARWQVGGDHTGRRVTRRPGRRCLGPASPTPSAAEDPSARETFPAASTRTSRVSPILLIYSPPPQFLLLFCGSFVVFFRIPGLWFLPFRFLFRNGMERIGVFQLAVKWAPGKGLKREGREGCKGIRV